MTKSLSSKPVIPLSLSLWPIGLIGIVVVRATVSLALRSGSSLLSYGAISYFILLLFAAGFAIRNGVQSTLGNRPFWWHLAIAFSLWAIDQWIFLYYEFGLHMDVPDNSIADPVLFLHIVPLMAAATMLPHRNVSGSKLYRPVLNSLLLLFFWGFLYAYAVFPYQYLFSSPTTYALRFDTLYLLENLALILTIGIVSLRMQCRWKAIYLHLLGASTLYALSSAVANTAIDSGGYINGRLYGLGLTASACWFVWVPLLARRSAGSEARSTPSDTGQPVQASTWAMLVVVMIAVPIVWELFRSDEAAGMRTFRLLVAVAAMVCLASVAYVKEYFSKSEMASQLGSANDRLRLAMESGKSVGWEWDLKTGRDSWFGDLPTIFGIPSDTFDGWREDFYRSVHPEDLQLVAKAVAESREGRKAYAAEFRVVRRDGTVRWVAATGQFYYGTNDDPERMLGMAVDITERKHAEESLRLFRKLMEESNDAIEIVDPKTLRFLDANNKSCRDLGYTREEFLSLRVPDVDPNVNESLLARVKKEVDESGLTTFESLHRRKDGSTFPVEINLKHVELDRTYVVNVVRDITERKRVEEALRQKDAELMEAHRLAGVGSFQWYARTDKVIWSEELYRIFGHDPNLPPPPNSERHSLFTPQSWERLRRIAKETLQTGTAYELDMEVVVPQSTAKWVIARGEPLRDVGGEVIGLRGTVQDITARKQAERAHRESEERLRLILDSTAEAIYGVDLEGRCTFCNPACLRALGYERVNELIGKDMHQLLHPTRGDGTPFPRQEGRVFLATRSGKGVHVDDELLWRANGTSFPAEYWCYPQWRGKEVVGAVVAFLDITQRKLGEAALASVSGKLIEAQEQERSRIARELHDDIGQRLALLAIELEQLQQSPRKLPDVRRRIGEMQKQATELAADIQSLSHELHSSRLQYLGITAAMRGFCKEFSDQQKVEIDFEANDLPAPLSPDISLCFFRVLQEALHNAAKHSGVRQFEVRLWGTPDEIHLTVSDSGSGFDTEAAKASPGLGLISMEERLRLLKGNLVIEAHPQRGTTVHASVPLR